jgi:ketosteroid isomerase-like protein
MSRAAGVVLAVLTLVPMPAASATKPTVTQQRVSAQGLVRSYVDAMNKADVATMMGMFSKRPGVTSIGDGEISRGWDSIRTDAQQIVGKEGTFKFTIGSIDVTPLGSSYSLVVAPFTFAILGQPDSVELPAAMTLVLERSGTTWKVLHEHWSSKMTDEANEEDNGDDGNAD